MKMMMRARLLGSLLAVSMLASCRSSTEIELDPNDPALAGTVSYIYATPAGTWYPGEVRVTGTRVGDIRAYVTKDVAVTVRLSSGAIAAGSFASFHVGDAVVVWYDPEGAMLKSAPPVYPVTRIEIRR